MILRLLGVAALLVASALAMLFLYPRPADTAGARVFASDGAQVDHCELPELDGTGALAADIPKAFTPGCGWTRWPMPVLANCTQPLAEGVADLRGLWRSSSPEGFDHVERVEQCGNRTVVTSSGILHDFVADGTLAGGARDIEPPTCMNTWVSIDWKDGIQSYHPFGLPVTIVTRERQGDELVWHYPKLGEVRMKRICRVPPEHAARG